jgi:hypothetical protein
MASTYKIYISSDSKDLDLARDLSKRLEKAGLKVTTSTGKINNPRDDKDRIENLRDADEVILLITDSAIQGNNVLFDLGAADVLEKRLAPVLVGLRPRELPDILKGLDFIKYDELERYIGRLQRRVGEVAKPPAKVEPKSGERSKSAA